MEDLNLMLIICSFRDVSVLTSLLITVRCVIHSGILYTLCLWRLEQGGKLSNTSDVWSSFIKCSIYTYVMDHIRIYTYVSTI